VFKFSTGLGPFVKTRTSSGFVGAAVTILGNDLTGTISVAFNGTAASFAVKSATEITATVPTDATTGTVQVITPNATLSSNVPYTVLSKPATPAFKPAAKTYTTAQTVTISDATAGSTIYYTTDGTTPTVSSTAYTGPVTISASSTLKAIALGPDDVLSGVKTGTYTIN
jgi:lipoprotein-anchoring transpeptidase ErfK/SrfK